MSKTQQFCTVQLADLYIGIEVERIQEVIRYQDMTRVPLAPPEIRGLINLRGQLVTAIDLRHRFALPKLEGDRLPMNVVVRGDDAIVSFLVDEIGEVLELQEEDFEPPPETCLGITKDLIRGVYKLKDRLCLILNTDRAMNVKTIG
ncbi:MAG: chemotaxis protein CheW [Kofleriaceae bacterium]|nr:chemotaxis protein CheW [Kofleriaceae bacterium]